MSRVRIAATGPAALPDPAELTTIVAARDADLVLDVRSLPNPYYDETLRSKSGRQPDVAAYVFRDAEAERALRAIRHMLSPRAVVVREGHAHDVDAAELVDRRRAEQVLEGARQLGGDAVD